MLTVSDKDSKPLPEGIESACSMTYRSTGLGIYGAVMRFAGMPLEKIALYMNSAQVSGSNQLRQAITLTFRDSQGQRSTLAPFRVVGPASIIAWFLQYSVMGMVFQVCDNALSEVLGVPRIPYGSQLMEDPSINELNNEAKISKSTSKNMTKIILAPVMAGTLESVVANRAEVQRYFGLVRFAQMESALNWNVISRLCGPAFLANSSRNCIMSATSFVATPMLYRDYYPQESKSNISLFWFGLGANIFLGNTIAITQQALWGRALDYSAASKNMVARNIHYQTVVTDGFAKEGFSAFFTFPKWFTRVLMNAPVQGTLPWFYNEILPLAESSILDCVGYTYWYFKETTERGRGHSAGRNSIPSVLRNASDENSVTTTATCPSSGIQ